MTVCFLWEFGQVGAADNKEVEKIPPLPVQRGVSPGSIPTIIGDDEDDPSTKNNSDGDDKDVEIAHHSLELQTN